VPSGIYHLSDGPGISTPDLARAIAAARHLRARLFRLPVSWLTSVAGVTGRQAQLSRLTGSLDVDSSHFRRSFGWHPPFTLEEGLRATLREPTGNAAGAPSGNRASG
jgi:UDP-glucose 4-epimerase